MITPCFNTHGVVEQTIVVGAERIKPDGIVRIAITVAKQRTSANGRTGISKASPGYVIVRERNIADRRVGRADDIVKQRALAKSVVAVSVGVEKKRISANGVVELTCRVGKQRECAARSVAPAGAIGQKR